MSKEDVLEHAGSMHIHAISMDLCEIKFRYNCILKGNAVVSEFDFTNVKVL